MKTAASTNINRFFTETLGAKLKNTRWSWGAVDSMTNRVFLRVWQGHVETHNNGERVLVAWEKQTSNSHGFAERQAHVAQIQNGAEGFGVLCKAVNPGTEEVAKITEFDHTTLLRLGTFTNENGRTYAHIDARVAVAQVVRQRTAQSTLTDDLQALAKQKIEFTTKEALVNARVGQGIFRSQVLQLWDHCCAVTRSATLDAIRASNIKPWRGSTNEERLDPNNGLPLIASLDALFDAGLISFDSYGTLIVSSKLDPAERDIFGVSQKSLARKPSAQTAEYLAYHRDNFFRK